MTPAAIELALEIRREIEARYEEADQLRCRTVERAQIEADLAQRRFKLVDPGNWRYRPSPHPFLKGQEIADRYTDAHPHVAASDAK